ncbi:hypothetical protein DLAC_08409 [Tieghemostelium lacteum]|uniref:Pru domain-containing protein n=1 Tax=Tieghemostelium lacteum TaxID=361077 RepID=A0A151ZBX7_TIELA|nr:hypothetical protein DLAC_08409 [Tieghemostelium lacteum]|eukprot:KYQ91441.1 hypothetical protein DLAC_08409 [Tieghemostelium lacteum]
MINNNNNSTIVTNKYLKEEVLLVIGIDNSQWMLNGDYLTSSRLMSQYIAIIRYIEKFEHYKIPFTIYIIGMARSPQVLKIMTSTNRTSLDFSDIPLNGECNLKDSLSTIHLIFRNKLSTNQFKTKQLLLFIGSPIGNLPSDYLSNEGMYYRNNQINLGIVSFGDNDYRSIEALYTSSYSILNRCFMDFVQPGEDLIIKNKFLIGYYRDILPPSSNSTSTSTSIIPQQQQKISGLTNSNNNNNNAHNNVIVGSGVGVGGSANCRKQGGETNRILKSKFLHYNLILDYNKRNQQGSPNINSNNSNSTNVKNNNNFKDIEDKFNSVREKFLSGITKIKALNESLNQIRSSNNNNSSNENTKDLEESLKETQDIQQQKEELYMEFLQTMRKLNSSRSPTQPISPIPNSKGMLPTTSATPTSISLTAQPPPNVGKSVPTNVMFLYKSPKIICEFPAGLCLYNSNSKMVEPVITKGHFSLVKIGISNFQISWRSHVSMKIEKSFLFDYKEATFHRVSNGDRRVFYFKFNYLYTNSNYVNNGDIQYQFIWPQYTDVDQDKYYIDQVNNVIMSPTKSQHSETKKQSLIKILSTLPQFQNQFGPTSSSSPSTSLLSTSSTLGNGVTSTVNGSVTFNNSPQQSQDQSQPQPSPLIEKLSSPKLKTFTQEFDALELKSKKLISDLDMQEPSPPKLNWTYSPLMPTINSRSHTLKRRDSWSEDKSQSRTSNLLENQLIKHQLEQEEKDLMFFSDDNSSSKDTPSPLILSQLVGDSGSTNTSPLTLSSGVVTNSTNSPTLTSTSSVVTTIPTSHMKLKDTIKSNSKISLFQPNPMSSIPIPVPLSNSFSSSSSSSLACSGSSSSSSSMSSSGSSSVIPSPNSSSSPIPSSGDIEMNSSSSSMSPSTTSSTDDLPSSDTNKQ